MSKYLTWPQWVDLYVHTQVGGSTPHSKLKQKFTARDLREYLKAQGHPSWPQASMFLQAHKHAMRWGSTDYMLRCDGKGPAAAWVVDDFDGAKASMETKIDSLSREHVTDFLCRAKRLAEGNSNYVGDPITETDIKNMAKQVVAAWNMMRSLVGLSWFDFDKSWSRKYVVTF